MLMVIEAVRLHKFVNVLFVASQQITIGSTIKFCDL